LPASHHIQNGTVWQRLADYFSQEIFYGVRIMPMRKTGLTLQHESGNLEPRHKNLQVT